MYQLNYSTPNYLSLLIKRSKSFSMVSFPSLFLGIGLVSSLTSAVAIQCAAGVISNSNTATISGSRILFCNKGTTAIRETVTWEFVQKGPVRLRFLSYFNLL
jgi:hypothetical protein